MPICPVEIGASSEGNNIRAMCRIADVSKNTVNKLLIDESKAFEKLYDEHVRNLKASVIQCDETS